MTPPRLAGGPVDVSAHMLLAHAGHWIGGVGASLVILAVAVAVFVRERRAPSDDD